jgi:O-antigen/teichoic acid export membrane protein
MFLGIFASETEVGIFAVALGLLIRITVIPDASISVVLPRSASDREGRPRLVAASMRIVGTLCVAILIAVGLTARPIVVFLFSSRFTRAIPVIWLLLPGFVACCATKLIVPYLNGTNRPGVQSWATAASLLVDCVGLSILYPVLGLAGAGIAMSISYITGSVILVVAFHKFTGMSFADVWHPQKSDLRQTLNIMGAVKVKLRKRGC